MAQIRLQPPESFNFKTADDWPWWKWRFEQFRIASGLSGEDPMRQVSTLLYCLREEGEAVLSSTRITAEERKEFQSERTQQPRSAEAAASAVEAGQDRNPCIESSSETVPLCDQETLFKLDTGAEVSAISQQAYQQLWKPQLLPSDKAAIAGVGTVQR